jgi:hypothetical protein
MALASSIESPFGESGLEEADGVNSFLTASNAFTKAS